MSESIGMKIALIVICLLSLTALYGLYKFGVWLMDALPAPGEY